LEKAENFNSALFSDCYQQCPRRRRLADRLKTKSPNRASAALDGSEISWIRRFRKLWSMDARQALEF
jgi:hypothetical protein